MFSVCTHLFRAVWVKKYKHHVCSLCSGPGKVPYLYHFVPSNVCSASEKRTGLLAPLYGWANGGWERPNKFSRVTQQKQRRQNLDLIPGLSYSEACAFNHYTLDGVRGHPRQRTPPRIHGNIQGDQWGPTECGVGAPAFPSARCKWRAVQECWRTWRPEQLSVPHLPRIKSHIVSLRRNDWGWSSFGNLVILVFVPGQVAFLVTTCGHSGSTLVLFRQSFQRPRETSSSAPFASFLRGQWDRLAIKRSFSVYTKPVLLSNICFLSSFRCIDSFH